MNRLHIVTPQADAIASAMRGRTDAFEIVAAPSFAALGDTVAQIEALVAFPFHLDPALAARMPRLRWLQVLTAGVDALTGIDLHGAVVSTVSGIHGPQMSEHAFMLLLALRRDLPLLLDQQKARVWQAPRPPLLAGSRLLIVGVGQIAEAVARRAQAFDMHVTGVSGSRREAPGFDRIVPTSDLIEAAATADHLIVLTPYSERTHHLISRAVIAALPPHAVLINIARGAVVDEAALTEALAHRRIAGAGLDVFEREPLPAGSALWGLPNVIVTPHMGGWSNAFATQVAPIVATNATRWFAGRRPLVNELG
ncbi:D-2-hydroxyacid dehydrogenase [Sphingomonas sp. MMS24-J13]|uniref:D-2-hydroxyacid dehydrogenase n=1 Tax=Sphingomonas sp. MMS24-J13 TaxID=3238686 RepID=UPI00384D906A